MSEPTLPDEFEGVPFPEGCWASEEIALGVAGDDLTGAVNEQEPHPLGWHVISGEDLLAMLRRVAAGENPDLV